MTPSEIYWLTRLDNIIIIAVIICAFSFLFNVLNTFLFLDGFESESERKQALKNYCISIPVMVITILALIFIPSTKEMAAIKVIPKIVNNEKVQTIADAAYDKAILWLNDNVKPTK